MMPKISSCALFVLTLALLPPSYAMTPVKHFFEAPRFSEPRLSPSGRYLAISAAEQGKRKGLAVIDTETNDIKPVIAYSDLDVENVQWISDNRLVYTVFEGDKARAFLSYAPGLFAIDRDGGQPRQLVEITGEIGVFRNRGGRKAEINQLSWKHQLIPQPGRRDSDWVTVVHKNYADWSDPRVVELKQVHSLTGATKTIPVPANTRQWWFDHGGELRATLTLDKEKASVLYRDTATAAWRELTSFNAYTGGKSAYEPVAFGANGTMYVEATVQGDKSALHAFDFSKGAVDPEPKIQVEDYDFSGYLISNKDKVLGARITTDAETTIWFDAAMQKTQAAVDAALPNTVNLISVPLRAEVPWVLVEAYSDRQPKSYLLFNSATKAIKVVSPSMPNIDATQMAKQVSIQYKARDGLTIPALLTLPPGKNPSKLPLVVLVHGGPWARGETWGWGAQSQFLASRGYAVLEPSFRGTSGLGYSHFQASWKQWGLAMQDDIADGAKWAIANGYADPARICIAGASYGGYSAMMGLINDPALYKCGINWAGVTDINLMYTGTWFSSNDITERYKQYGMPYLVGDPVTDAEQLKATSPLLQAARIHQPVLLAYGGFDARVPLHHGEKLYAALKQTNADVEWIKYSTEGHGWYANENTLDFWTRVEAFLDKHIGKKP